MGEERGEVVVRGTGRCGGGGAEMWGRQAAEVRLRCKSDEDF